MNAALKFTVLAAILALGLATSVSPLLSAEVSSFREEGISRLGVLGKKFLGLAEAMPAGKYTWRPAEGVRSVSEVLLHVTGANYGIPRFLGTPPPAGFDPSGFEKSTTDKTAIISKLKESFAHFRQAIEKLAPTDGDKPVKMFGRDTTMRGALLMALDHLSEHLGQSIAYARMNGVVPPWSQ